MCVYVHVWYLSAIMKYAKNTVAVVVTPTMYIQLHCKLCVTLFHWNMSANLAKVLNINTIITELKFDFVMLYD